VTAAAPRALDVRTARTTHGPDDRVRLLVDAAAGREVVVEVTHLGDPVSRQRFTLRPGRQEVDLGLLAEGSYAVVVGDESGSAATAFDVLRDPRSRPRYGFLTDFGPDRRDDEDLADSLRAHHITVVQLYDWMYRHADLLPPSDDFLDALGRPLSLGTVRRLVETVHGIGAQALGYAAVYGAGQEYASAHPDEVLQHRDGSPWMLADFLWIMDISPSSAWSRHIVETMRDAVEAVGFDGLHLDQYGHPKVAVTAAGEPLDLAEAFPAFIDAVREALPSSTLIFNNVNDFPTRRTVVARQDATYVEVWSPHDDYADLVRLVEVARDLAPTLPVILAAYLEPFATAGGPAEVTAATLALATGWAAGGQYLLFGEVAGLLVDPYYPRFATLDTGAVAVLRAFGDFAVANGDLLFAVDSAETSASVAGGVNEDVRVDGAAVSGRPVAGHVWLRTSRVAGRLVLQLVDYRGQPDSRWNRPRTPGSVTTGLTLRVRVVSPDPAVRFGHPRGGPALRRLDAVDGGDWMSVTVPDFDTWALLVVDE
jgi:dextranase